MNKTPFQDVERRAKFGDPFSQVLFGFFLEHGWRVAPDKEAALQWYERAAKQDFAPGQYALAFLLDDSESVRKVRWLNEASKLDYAPAQFILGCIYQEGKLTESNHELALYWIKKAADQGFSFALSHLSFMYEEGYGVECDPDLALRYMREAAERGSIDAAFLLGAYLTRQDDSAKVEEGLRWIWKAAEKGNQVAYFHLEGIFEFGEHGVQKDKKLSKYFRSRRKLELFY